MSQGNSAYRLEIAGAARRRLAKLAKGERERIDKKIVGLASDPRPTGVKKLTDRGSLFRIRVGDYRIVFTIDDVSRIVAVEDVRGRDDIYRKV